MNDFIQKYSTQLIFGLFIISLISGVALFFHWQSGFFHAMHEWLSMVLIVPFIMHAMRHWKPLKKYFSYKAMPLVLILSTVAALAFPLSASQDGKRGRPEFAVVQLMSDATIDQVAPIFHFTTEEMKSALIAEGYQPSDDMNLQLIARNANKNMTQMYASLLEYKQQNQ